MGSVKREWSSGCYHKKRESVVCVSKAAGPIREVVNIARDICHMVGYNCYFWAASSSFSDPIIINLNSNRKDQGLPLYPLT